MYGRGTAAVQVLFGQSPEAADVRRWVWVGGEAFLLPAGVVGMCEECGFYFYERMPRTHLTGCSGHPDTKPAQSPSPCGSTKEKP